MPKWPILGGMETKPRTCHELILALGGPVQLARKLGMDGPMPATLHWKSRGIPARYWHRVADLLAQERGIELSAHEVERLPVNAEAA